MNPLLERVLDGQIWEIELSEFPNYTTLESLRCSITTTCKRAGIKIRTSTIGGVITIQKIGER
jgi:hypothetical protein